MAAHRSKSVFLPGAVKGLSKIIKETGSSVVISSSWRMDQMSLLETVFADHGLHMILERIIGSTPVLDPCDDPTREDEIGCWLHGAQYRGRMAILDDEPCLGDLSRWHVAVEESQGLVQKHAAASIELLNRGPLFDNW